MTGDHPLRLGTARGRDRCVWAAIALTAIERFALGHGPASLAIASLPE